MSDRIDQAFDETIAITSNDREREALMDARRVFDVVRRIASPSDRQAVIGVLEQFDTLAELADVVAERRVIPFPHRLSSQR